MSNKAHIKNNQLIFDEKMYSNLYGTFGIVLVQCGLITKEQARRVWKDWKMNKVEMPALDDENLIEDLLAIYKANKDDQVGMMVLKKHLAYVQSTFNQIFSLYIDGVLLPLREDGLATATANKGKIYPVNW